MGKTAECDFIRSSSPLMPFDLNPGRGCVWSIYEPIYQRKAKHPGVAIIKHNVAKLTVKHWLRLICPENVVSAFLKSGIYRYFIHTIVPSQWDPSVICETESETIPETELDTIP